jgi:hypothetical protein
LIAAGLGAARFFWPSARIVTAGSALARVELAPFGERVATAAVLTPSGRSIGASVHSGLVEPVDELASGSRMRVELTVHRAGWLGWLVGSTEHVQAVFETPVAHLSRRLVSPVADGAIEVAFSSRVSVVSLQLGSGPRRILRVSPASRIVSLGVTASGVTSAGTALVAGKQRSWERLPPPVRVSWFPSTPTPELLARPAPQTTLAPTAPIVLTFSRPVSALLGTRRPTLWPQTPGVWHEPNAHTLVFQPGGVGFPLGAHVRLGLTRAFRVVTRDDPSSARTLSWQVPPGSTLRLEQLLAQLGYLPLVFHPTGERVPLDATALTAAALSPPAGTLNWRYKPPTSLRQLWQSPAERQVVIRGALMAFESVHDLTPDGEASPQVWRALLSDELAGKNSRNGYTYVHVSEALPETLTLWHNGRVILQTPINTGIPGRATSLGTYPVYLHLSSTTMSGINPDGTPYSDPDVPWVNYFSGGDAVHGFIRPSYGYPQSLGCVEAPIPTAARIFPYVQVGTLVTIAA